MPTPPAEIIYGGFGVAAYGAAVSTYLALRGVRRSRPKIRVLARGFSPADPAHPHEKYVEIVAYNPRDRVVEVADVGLTVLPLAWLPDLADPLNDGTVTFPVRLAPGESKRFHFEWPIDQTIHGWCEDALGRYHRGTPGPRARRLTLWISGPVAPWRNWPLAGRLSRVPVPEHVSRDVLAD